MSTQRKVFRENNVFRILGLVMGIGGLFVPIRQLDFVYWKPDSISLFVGVGLVLFAWPTVKEVVLAILNRGAPKQ